MTYMSLFWNEIVEAGYYDKVFKNGNVKNKSPQSVWHDKTFKKISALISNDNILLDYACGPATFTGQYLDLDTKPICLDISYKQIEYAKRNYKNKAVYYTVDNFDFESHSNEFDTITCLGLFEFISEEEGKKLLSKFYKLLKPNGKLHITTPNFKISMKILEYFLNKIGKLDYSKEYKSRYTKKTFNNLLINSQFNVIKIEKYMTPMIFMSLFGNNIGIFLDNLLSKLFKNNYGYILLYSLQK